MNNQTETTDNNFWRSSRRALSLLMLILWHTTAQSASLNITDYTTLNDLVVAIKSHMPEEDSEAYTVPDAQTRSDVAQVVATILSGQNPATIALPASLQSHYTISELIDSDNGQTYVVLAETADLDDNGVADRGWSAMIFNTQPNAKDISIDIPHPLNDSGTPEQGIAIFKGTNARTFVMSGAHRNANNVLAPFFNDSDYKIADAAHNEAHTFHAIVSAINTYYDAQFQTHTAFQFHGMGEASSNGLDVYMTHGSKRTPLPNAIIDQIKTQLLAITPTWLVAVPGDPIEGDLNGISNLQGRLLNGVCPEAVGQTRAYSYTGQFVHIEQLSTARVPSAYGDWIQTLNNLNFAIVPPPPGYWITSPNGGETWEVGTPVSITWNTQNAPEDVDIGLYKDGDYEKNITHATANDGEYTWVVDANLTEGSDYEVRIKNTLDEDNRDYSDLPFTIIVGNNTPEIAVSSPNGNETWDLGAEVLITWTSNNVPGNVKISLHKNGEYEKTIASNTENDGEYTWTVPLSTTPDNDYTVRVRSEDNTSLLDFSDATFFIEEGNSTPSITVLSPNGGETWTKGQQVMVTWQSNAISGPVKISLHKNGSFYKTIAASTENDGEYTWTVSSSVSIGSNYTVRVRSEDNTSIQDFSDANITVQDAGSALSLEGTYPNPFNPETTIRYTLSEDANVEITIYDILGQQIAQLVNQTQNAGYHVVHFDARHLASGFYLYRIRANNQIATGKMMLLK